MGGGGGEWLRVYTTVGRVYMLQYTNGLTKRSKLSMVVKICV